MAEQLKLFNDVESQEKKEVERRTRRKVCQKKYRKKHKKQINIQRRIYRAANKEAINKKRNEKYKTDQKIRDKITKANKERLLKPGMKERRKLYLKTYLQRPIVKERLNKRLVEKRKTDIKYKLNNNMSRAVGKSLKGKKNGRKWLSLVSYTLNDLIKRLKNTVPKGYTWDDYIVKNHILHIDHIIPVSAHNFKTPNDEDFKRCWALKNLQLLPAKENMSKGAKLTKHFQPSLRMAL